MQHAACIYGDNQARAVIIDLILRVRTKQVAVSLCVFVHKHRLLI
jgi:hypothetical protein